MPLSFNNPPGVRDPGGRYSHAAVIEGPGRRLVISGQVGVAPDGTIPPAGEAQIAQAVANLGAVLAANGMGPANVVKLGIFLTDAAHIPVWRAERAKLFGTLAPASTLLIVAGLADPRYVFEVEAEAFAA
jgi:enamine deaminase RidA (YjgF/YER057c/UK114 family)